MTNLIVLSYLLITNPPSMEVFSFRDGRNVGVSTERIEAVTEIGFKSRNGIVKIGESRTLHSTRSWTNAAKVLVEPPPASSGPAVSVAPSLPSTNSPTRGQIQRQQRERERTNTVAKPATNTIPSGQLLRQQREFERTNTAKVK